MCLNFLIVLMTLRVWWHWGCGRRLLGWTAKSWYCFWSHIKGLDALVDHHFPIVPPFSRWAAGYIWGWWLASQGVGSPPGPMGVWLGATPDRGDLLAWCPNEVVCVSGLLQGWLGMSQAGGQHVWKLDCPLGPMGVQSNILLLTGRIYLLAAPVSLLMSAVIGLCVTMRRLVGNCNV